MRVLVVDDERMTRRVLARRLRMARIEVIEASDGREALDEVRKHAPDVIISDVQMPNVDGVELVRALRSAGCSTKVYLMSGDTGMLHDAVEELLNTGEVEHLFEKPAGIAELLRQLRQAA